MNYKFAHITWCCWIGVISRSSCKFVTCVDACMVHAYVCICVFVRALRVCVCVWSYGSHGELVWEPASLPGRVMTPCRSAGSQTPSPRCRKDRVCVILSLPDSHISLLLSDLARSDTSGGFLSMAEPPEPAPRGISPSGILHQAADSVWPRPHVVQLVCWKALFPSFIPKVSHWYTINVPNFVWQKLLHIQAYKHYFVHLKILH